MKIIIYSTIFFITMLSFSLQTGCGNGENQSTKIEPEPAMPIANVEKETGSSTENYANQSTEIESESAISIAKAEKKTEPSIEDYENQPKETEPSLLTKPQLDIQEVADEIVIENQGYETDKKKPVKLSHKKHNEEYQISCAQCHHVYEDDKNVWKEGDHVEKCIFCHDPTMKQEDILKLQSAFHNNCRTCHKEISQEGKEAPYKKCTECHG